MSKLSLVAVAVAALLSGCAQRKFPGTDIPDTEASRQVIEVVNRYRSALEARDADAILALLSESFHDTAGTGTPQDDLTYRDMREVLPKRMSQLEDVRAEFNVRDVRVEGDTATVVYHYDTKYELPRFKSRPLHDSDLQQMVLQRVGNEWKIISGI